MKRQPPKLAGSVKLGWKFVAVKNALAYTVAQLIADVKSFMVLAIRYDLYCDKTVFPAVAGVTPFGRKKFDRLTFLRLIGQSNRLYIIKQIS
jgi:hypothetical protein